MTPMNTDENHVFTGHVSCNRSDLRLSAPSTVQESSQKKEKPRMTPMNADENHVFTNHVPVLICAHQRHRRFKNLVSQTRLCRAAVQGRLSPVSSARW